MIKSERKIVIEYADSKPVSLRKIAIAIAEQYQKERGNAKCKMNKSTANY